MRGFLIAVTFLTRLPFPAPQEVTHEEFTASQRYYPIVGLLIGLILLGSTLLLQKFYSPLVIAALLLIEELLLTGGIHMDGFMDSMDALWSARTPERMLEIMKDSRVGAFGAISAIALLLLKFSLLSSLLQTHSLPSWGSLLPILLMPVFSRWMFLIGVLFYPYARETGLGKGFHESSQKKPILFLLEGFVCLTLAAYFLGWAGLIGFVIPLLFIFVFTHKVSALLGGLTGDLYGASIELAEILFLMAVIPVFRS